jgi:hypothetical protein
MMFAFLFSTKAPTRGSTMSMVAGGSVTVLSHPSLAGIASGSGISGSTAWHRAFRFRQHLKGIKASDGEQSDSDIRELEFKKNQYGPIGEAIVYSHGVKARRYSAPARASDFIWVFLGIAALAELGVQRRPKYPKMNKTTTMTPMM